MFEISTLPCRDFPLQMWLWLSDELPKAEQKFWQAHLQNCSHCREILENAQTVQTQYASLPLRRASASVLHRVIRRAPTQSRATWWEAFGRRFAIFFNFKPRLAFAGIAFTILMLSFHYFAFQQPTSSAWEAAVFDARAEALASALLEYGGPSNSELNPDEHVKATQFSWEAQATGLRASIAALQDELQNSKL